jgi:hypothetical protein
MLWCWLIASLASAAVPDGVTPLVTPVDLPEQVKARVGETGAIPLCESVWEGVALVCYRQRTATGSRWVTQADLAGWETDAAGLRREMVQRAESKLVTELEKIEVQGMAAHYWRATTSGGWAAAGLLNPRWLSEVVGGGPVAMAVPALDVLVAWRAGDEELDRVMAVGVHEMYTQQRGSISPRSMLWTGTAWAPYIAAQPRTASDAP